MFEPYRDLKVIATELGYGDPALLKTADGLSNEVSKMLDSLMAKL
ncbi:MAG: hypothetical protein ACRD3K_10775 [Edaphobacter sp.]